MDFSVLNVDGAKFLLRWFHYFFGIVWIGHLYYFNFVQGAFFAEIDAATKNNCISKLVPRALWWFRWGAMFTFITGLLILGLHAHQFGVEIFVSSWGASILTGAALATCMWFNVWFVIWPKQQIVIQSAQQVLSGGQALPDAAASGARALQASRTNTLFSIPMLFYMGAASHLAISTSLDSSYMLYTIIVGALILLLELNALVGKKLGPITSVKGVIHCGFALAVVIYVIMELAL